MDYSMAWWLEGCEHNAILVFSFALWILPVDKAIVNVFIQDNQLIYRGNLPNSCINSL